MVYGTIALTIVCGLFGLIFIAMVFARLCKKATSELAFVRSGLSGERVIFQGLALCLPFVHDVMPVSLNSMKLTVSRKDKDALMSKDRIRFDATAEVFVIVEATAEGISKAARTLGSKTLDSSKFSEFIEAKVIAAFRSASAQMNFFDIHENREDLVARVNKALAEDIKNNGLRLESVSLTYFDQTKLDQYESSNLIDAYGLTVITQETENKKKERNATIQENNAIIAKDTYEAEVKIQELKAKTDKLGADTEGNIRANNAEADKKARLSEMQAQLAVEQSQKDNVQSLKLIDIEQSKKLQLEKQKSEIEINGSSIEESRSKAEALAEAAKAAEAEEVVVGARVLTQARIQAETNVIQAKAKAEVDQAHIVVAATNRKLAAEAEAEALRIETEATVESRTKLAEMEKVEGLVRAENTRLLNEAQANMTAEQCEFQMRIKFIEALPAILETMVKPMEKISDIKILQVNGGMFGTEGAGSSESNASLPDQVVNSALKYKVGNGMLQGLFGMEGANAGFFQGFDNKLNQVLGLNLNEAPVDAEHQQPGVTAGEPAPEQPATP